LHCVYPNQCHKIAESCVLALGLPKPLPENCRELRPCTEITKTNTRKLPRAASLHWAYQNYCQKIAESCVIALGLPEPMSENCRQLRPCTVLPKTNARNLPRVASLHWAYQNQRQEIAESCIRALGLPEPMSEDCRDSRPCTWVTKTTARKLRPCTWRTKTNARKLPRVASLHWACQNHCQNIAESCVLTLG